MLDVPLGRARADVDAHREQLTDPITVKTAVHETRSATSRAPGRFPGVQIANTYLRHYPYQSLAAQVLGYVGEISPAAAEGSRKRDYGYSHAGRQDRAGRGRGGVRRDTCAAAAARRRSASTRSAGRRAPLEPTTDARSRGTRSSSRSTSGCSGRPSERSATASRSRSANGQWAANGGAIVALDPSNGAVLALASNPTYKPSLFTRARRPREGRATPRRRRPRRPRTTRASTRRPLGLYPPGSTWKPVTALAAMQEHLLSPYESIQCTPQADVRASTSTSSRTGTLRQPADDAHRGARPVVRHVLLRRRRPLLPARPGNRLVAAPGLGRAVRLRRADRSRHRHRGGGAAADAGVAEAALSRSGGTRPGTRATRSCSPSARRT